MTQNAPDPEWQTHPVTPDRFEDFADVINPTRQGHHCWCLAHRLGASDIDELGARRPRGRDAHALRARRTRPE